MRKRTILAAALAGFTMATQAQQVSEKLNRAPVAVKTSEGVLVSWRWLTTDAKETTFNVYRNGTLVKENISDVTNYLDKEGKPGDTYRIETSRGETSEAKAWDNIFTSFDVKRPASIKSGNTTGRYRPDDMAVGDVDGDGNYELILKWLPDNQRDSGKDGYASPVIISAYRMDGTPLWQKDVNLGPNIRSGNHTTQLVVFDLDGDGKAEVLCKTAAGSTDGTGKYVTEAGDDAIRNIDNTKEYVNSKGRVTGGEELLTVFRGLTGEAMKTIWYSPSRSGADFPSAATDANSFWGDKDCNRAERFNAAVAYLDGTDKLPTAILQRGYYKNCYIWAVDWNGSELSTRWLHRGQNGKWDVLDANGNTLSSGSGKSSFGQGVHGISVGDVNTDGYDEICIGAATIAHDGKLLCSTGMGHGDAIHLADLCPDRPGLEVMMPHEEGQYGYDVHDATTGEILVSATGHEDNGRGLAADFIPANRGFEFWSSADSNTHDCATGDVVMAKKADTNFRIYWTGDPYDQTFDGRYDAATGKSAPRIRSYNTAGKNIITFQEFAAYGSPSACNTTKATPCLQADLLGDWREELIMYQYEADWSSPTCKILIYSTPEPTSYKVPCLMQDHLYRMGIVWQNSSYNQPPHLGYSLPDYLGIDGAAYVTQTKSHAPEAAPAEDPKQGEEQLATPAADKQSVKGICYTAGENGEITDSKSSAGYIKVRTNNGDAILFSVNEGYEIIGMTLEGYSNNASTTADRSIMMTGTYIDGSETSILDEEVKYPGGTAGQTPVSKALDDFTAKKSIRLTFDNSNITTSDVDAKGKNKQLYLKVTFKYRKTDTDGISAIETKTVTLHSDNAYSLDGKLLGKPAKGGIFVKGGKKFVSK